MLICFAAHGQASIHNAFGTVMGSKNGMYDNARACCQSGLTARTAVAVGANTTFTSILQKFSILRSEGSIIPAGGNAETFTGLALVTASCCSAQTEKNGENEQRLEILRQPLQAARAFTVTVIFVLPQFSMTVPMTRDLQQQREKPIITAAGFWFVVKRGIRVQCLRLATRGKRCLERQMQAG
jgi:hypothetical protein